MNALEAAALRYASRWHVIPLAPRDKRPLIADWPRLASRDPEQVARWWTDTPDANIGLVPALSGLVVFDVDSPEAEATAAFLGLTAEPTLTVTTGRTDFAGRHLYFDAGSFRCGNLRLLADDGRLRSVSADLPGLEVKSAAGQVVLPPSIHPSGRTYRWSGTVSDLRPLPAGAIDALHHVIQVPDRAPVSDVIPEGARDTALTSLGGALRRRGASEGMILTAIAAINVLHCDPPLSDRDVERIAKSMGRYQPAEGGTDRYASAVR